MCRFQLYRAFKVDEMVRTCLSCFFGFDTPYEISAPNDDLIHDTVVLPTRSPHPVLLASNPPEAFVLTIHALHVLG